MAYRLVGRAEDRIAKILVDSARRHGFDAAARYNHLILIALDAIGNSPYLPGSREVPREAGLRTLHLKRARRLVAPGYRVSEPRHLVLYRQTLDGTVEILSLIHDRMLVLRAARRAQREADSTIDRPDEV